MSADTTPTAVRREHGYGWRVRVDGLDYESGEVAYSTERAAIEAGESYARDARSAARCLPTGGATGQRPCERERGQVVRRG